VRECMCEEIVCVCVNVGRVGPACYRILQMGEREWMCAYFQGKCV